MFCRKYMIRMNTVQTNEVGGLSKSINQLKCVYTVQYFASESAMHSGRD